MADDRKHPPEPESVGPDRAAGTQATEEGGDAACWAHLVCPECGNVVSEGHRPGCNYTGDA